MTNSAQWGRVGEILQYKNGSFNVGLNLSKSMVQNGLIQVKEEGLTGFSEGWQGCSEGFPEGEARGKS